MVEDKNPKDESGVTPLHEAAMHGNEDIVQIIIAVVDEKNPKDNNGSTPLDEADKNGHEEIFKILLDKVEENNQVINEALLKAIYNNDFESCQMILDKAWNKNPKDCHGSTPLHHAAIIGCTGQVFLKNQFQIHIP